MIENSQKKIETNINWVLINELAIGPKPDKEIMYLKLKELRIRSILSLCSEEEFLVDRNFIKEFTFARVILPDHKYKNQLNFNQLSNAINQLKKLMKNGSVYVHCVAAVERSPLICMAWLMKEKNLSKFNALEYLMRINPGTSPTPHQLSILDNL